MAKLSLYAAIVLQLITIGCSFDKEKKQDEKYTVTRPIIIDTVYYIDYVSDIHSVKNVEIRSRVKGYVESILVDEGKSVKKGQILFRISDQEYKEEVLKAKANLKNAIAEAKSAELNLQNVKVLVDKNVVSKTELDMAHAKLDALNANIEEAKSHEVSAQLKLSFTEVRAPFDGIIDRIPNKVGSLIDEGTLLTTLSDNSEVFAYFNVSEKEYLDFTSDQSGSYSKAVSLILANNEQFNYEGQVETIEGEFDNSTGSIAFRARFPNPDKVLKHGSTGKIRLKRSIQNALVIPQKSTFEIQDRMFVYVVGKDNIAQMRSVQPKLRIPHLYIMESGITANDKFIYEGIQDVREGMEIAPEFVSLKSIIPQLENQ
ncbi:MAG: efflux RND transporter periplasmic adaptor subunit [Cytophaga sp.]|uniref:efflux RND transporter periplasmic adaptor subunit n=1 Tax=Cytophaga sp. TaxID=29535 RepID=UPI003F7DE50E